ncbi:MAG: hypothetical protein C0485_08235 [Pirellula sp.]|nr:hypothetical protein [Pirellula sp.]
MANMLPFLTFKTSDELDWSIRGDMLRKLLGDHLASIGYAVDYETDPYEPDWYFKANRGGDFIGVILVLDEVKPRLQWWVDVQRVLPTREQLTDGELRTSLMLQFEKCLASCDFVSDLELNTSTCKPPLPSPHRAWEVVRWLLFIAFSLAFWFWVTFFRHRSD